jgi:ribosomal-protein-alanine N-acetyltransferase
MLKRCAFRTEFLFVKEWNSLGHDEWLREDHADLVARIMTEPVTQTLPEHWQGRYTLDRARAWVDERNSEGVTLLAVDRSTREAVGFVILFEAGSGDSGGGADLRLGYLLAEQSWGKGLATELLAGLVDWCREQHSIVSITGGVSRDNPGSVRVLEKCGFRKIEHPDESSGECLYRLEL